MNILIIDDDAEDTALFCEALSEIDPAAKYVVAHTCEGLDAQIALQAPDIIFLDAHMYPIDGRTCLQQIMKVLDHSKTRIVIHSGSISAEEQLDLQARGADHFLIKALTYPLLKDSIRGILQRTSGNTTDVPLTTLKKESVEPELGVGE